MKMKTYRKRKEEDRMYPSFFHSRFWILTLLRRDLKYLIKSDLVVPGDQILDFGSGNSPYRSLFLNKFKKYITADLPGNKNAGILIGKDGKIDNPDESFDCVLSSQVLEHIADPGTYLDECYRLMKKDGKLILSTHGMWLYHADPCDYYRWTREGLECTLEKSGFKVELIRGVMNDFSFALQVIQDRIGYFLPSFLRIFCFTFFQGLIGICERLYKDPDKKNASVYIVIASKKCLQGRDENVED
jgi:SAM-dependent methyltransferase